MGRPRIPIGKRLADNSLRDPSGCVLWTAFRDKDGYGKIGIHHADGTKRALMAHRVSYEYHVGPIPEGFQIDHLCRVHACINPDHLEPVTNRVNVVKRGTGLTAQNHVKTHCVNGHEFTPENTAMSYRRSHPRRSCIACRRASVRRARARQRARVSA